MGNIIQKSNKSLIIVVLSLLLFGLIVIYNATAYYAQFTFGNPFKFVLLQLVWISLGLVVFSFFSNYSYKKLEKLSYLLFVGSILFLVVLAISGTFLCQNSSNVGIIFAPCINGASRWLYLNPSPLPQIPFVGILGFQPAELVKLSIILYLSTQLNKLEKKKGVHDPFMVYMGTSILLSILLLLQPNMSNAVLVFLIGTVIYFVSGNSLKPLILSSPIIFLTSILVMLSSAYRRTRLFTLLGFSDGSIQEASYHIRQVLIALGSGGLFGLGFGQSRQKYQYLPELASDSIFAIIGEEFGFVGTTLVILAFTYLIYLGYKIAKNAPDMLGRMLAFGVTSWIALQFFVNIAAMTKTIPLTGVPIPLISHGGSGIFFVLLALGILNNIQKES